MCRDRLVARRDGRLSQAYVEVDGRGPLTSAYSFLKLRNVIE